LIFHNNKPYAFIEFEVIIIIFIEGISLVLEPNMGLTQNMNCKLVTVLQPHLFMNIKPLSVCTSCNINQLQIQCITHQPAFLCRFLQHNFCIKWKHKQPKQETLVFQISPHSSRISLHDLKHAVWCAMSAHKIMPFEKANSSQF